MNANSHLPLLTLEDRYHAVFNEKALRETIISYAVGARSANYSSTDARKLCQVSSTWRKSVLAILVRHRLPLFPMQVGDPNYSESWKNLFKSWGESSLYQNRAGGPRNLPPFSAEIDARAFKEENSSLRGFITALEAGGGRSLVEIKIVTPIQVVGGPQVHVSVPRLPSNLTFPALRCVTYAQETRIWWYNRNRTFVYVDDVRLKDFIQFFLDQAPEVERFESSGIVIPFRPSLFTFRLPPTLKELRITSHHLPALSADLRAGRTFTDLKILHISNLELKDSQEDFLNILENCGRTLKELHLSGPGWGEQVTMNLSLAKFPVLPQLRKLDIGCFSVTWLPKDDFSVDLSSRFPKLEFLYFAGNGLHNLVDGFCHKDSRYPNMDYLTTPWEINLLQGDYYSKKPAPAEIVRCISTAFPNLTKMKFKLKDRHTSGLTSVFRYMTNLKDLEVQLCPGPRLDPELDEAMWDALIIGTNVPKVRDLRQDTRLWLPWLAEAKKREEQGKWDFQDFAPSVRNLKNLKTFKFAYGKQFKIIVQEYGGRLNAKLTYISFILGLKRVKTLEEVDCGDEFGVTQDFKEMVGMYEKCEVGQEIRRLFGETVEG